MKRVEQSLYLIGFCSNIIESVGTHGRRTLVGSWWVIRSESMAIGVLCRVTGSQLPSIKVVSLQILQLLAILAVLVARTARVVRRRCCVDEAIGDVLPLCAI